TEVTEGNYFLRYFLLGQLRITHDCNRERIGTRQRSRATGRSFPGGGAFVSPRGREDGGDADEDFRNRAFKPGRRRGSGGAGAGVADVAVLRCAEKPRGLDYAGFAKPRTGRCAAGEGFPRQGARNRPVDGSTKSS